VRRLCGSSVLVFTWLAEGDRNTRFFHLRTTQQRRRNRISKLKMADGSFTEDEAVMASMTTDFFRSIKTAEGTEDIDQLLDTVSTKVTGEMNDMLLKLIDLEEVKNALFGMFPTKAPALTVSEHISFRDTGTSMARRS